MSTIEERVVAMKFQGEQFLAGIDKSLQKLDQFNNKLKMTEGTKGLDGVGAAAQRQTGALSRVAEGVQHISDRFKAMGIVGMAAIENVTNQAIFKGQQLVKSLSVEPLLQGFREYETNLNSIQTILANTQASGATLKDVTATLDDLNRYSDQTIYNFSQMAKNIGTFTAAGVGLKPAAAAIKGIANLAALSGSNSEQASGAMYQLSQAISSGRVSLQDWNSVVNAGMGGTVFQRALAQTAEKMGTLDKGAVKLSGSMKTVSINGKSFRESIDATNGPSWLTSKVLTQTLAQFTGDLSDAQLAVMGFNATEIAAIQKQAAVAKAAATEVKTMSQLLGTLKESAGSGWAQTWKTIFGDFEGAKKLFTNVNNVLGGFVSASADARNKVLGDWAKLGGRTALINAIGNSFKALVSVMKPIRDAFREIFPPATGKQLADISKTIERFTKNLTVSGTTANNIKRTFAGLFAVVGIGWDILKGLVGVIGRLVGVVFDGSGGFLDFTGNVGDFLVGIRKAIKDGNVLTKFFEKLGDVLELPIKALKAIGSFLGSVFGDFDGTKAAEGVAGLAAKLEPLGRLGDIIAAAWDKVISVLDNVWSVFEPLADRFAEFFANFGSSISEAVGGLDFSDVLGAINTGLFAGLVLTLRNMFGGGGGNGIFAKLRDSIDAFTDVLGAMQNTLRAATLLQIAAAIGILAIAMNTLSKIDADGLTRASVAMGAMFAQLIGSLIAFEQMSGFKGFAKMPFVAGAMILLAVAVNILASAAKKLAELDWNGLAKGLTGLTVMLGSLVATVQLMPNDKKLISTGLGLIVLAGAVKLLVGAVTDLSGLSWEEMSKGLVGVGALLASLAIFTRLAEANKGGLAQGAGIILLAVGIKILASAMEDFVKFSWEEIGRGLTAMAGGLALIAGALNLIPPTALLSAAGVLVVAASLGMIADALQDMGKMSWGEIGKGLATMAGALALIAGALALLPPSSLLSAAAIFVVASSLSMIGSALQTMGGMTWEEIAKGLVTLAGSLAIIAGAMALMTGALPGAAALLVVAGSLAILTPILVTLGNMTWEEIAKGLLTLAGVFVVLGVAGLVLTPLVPTLLGLGVAVTLLGVGMLAAGLGVFLFATGLTALSVAGAAGAAAIVAIVSALIGLIPMVMTQIGLGIVAFAKVIATAGPAITMAIVTVLNSLINAIAIMTPKIVTTLLRLLLMMLEQLAKYVPKMADAGLRLLTGLLGAIAKNIGKVVKTATDVVVNFINGISNNLDRIIQAGVNLIVKFVEGLAKAIRNNSKRMGEAGGDLASAIVEGMAKGIFAGVGKVVDAAKNVAKSALDAAKNFLGIKSPSKEFEKIGRYVNDGFRKGLDGNKGQIDAAFNSLKSQLSSAMKDSKKDVDALYAKLKKLTSARHKDSQAIAATRAQLAQAKKEYVGELRAYDQVTRALNSKHTALGKLATQQDLVSAKLDAANKSLQDAIKTRDDFNKQIRDQFDNLPDISGEDTTLASYVTDLRKQIEDTQVFASGIQRLRDLGLNDTIYKELLAKGTSALPFINDVLAAGKDGVNELNKLSGQLGSVAGGLGNSASKELYQAGVNAAQGLVDGLKKQQAAIEKQMDTIAAAMIKAIKKALGIKSPSREFMKIGSFSAEGLTWALKASTPKIEKASAEVGRSTVESLRKSLSNMPDILSNIDAQPTIRPILDLSNVKRGVGTIGRMIPGHRISVGTAYSSAKDASAGYQANRTIEADGILASHTELNYTQNNYSPKALTSAEIYRQTNNQLSRTKGALTSANAGRS